MDTSGMWNRAVSDLRVGTPDCEVILPMSRETMRGVIRDEDIGIHIAATHEGV